MLALQDAVPPSEEKLKLSGSNETYPALVWRRLKRSWTGMSGLTLVILLLLMSIFAEFIAPLDPKATDSGFAPPQTISFHDKDGKIVFQPRVYALAETDELDPVTFQPVVGPDYDNPRLLGLFVKGDPYHLFGLMPADRHLFGTTDGQPVHFL